MTNKKNLSLLIASLLIAGCGGGGGSTPPVDGGSSGGNPGEDSGSSQYLPYTAERITPKTFASLGGDIQHLTQTDDSLCTFAALSGQCDSYSYRSAAYSLPEETDSASLDDVATTLFAVDSYIETQAELWGFATEKELLSTVALKTDSLAAETAELIAYDLERQAAAKSTRVPSQILAAAAAHKRAGDLCRDLGFGELTENHCAAERYLRELATNADWQLTIGKVLRTAAAQYSADAGYFNALCLDVPSSQVMCTLSKEPNHFSFKRVGALFGEGQTAQIKVAGFAYRGDNNKGGYLNGAMSVPNNLNDYPEFDAKVINHELTHLFIDAMASNGLLGTNPHLNFMVEGIPTLFARQQVWNWTKMAELAQGGGDYLLTMDDYATRAALVNYLLVAKSETQARDKQDVMVNFIKTLSSKGDTVKAFNEAGFTNHQGAPVTLDTLRGKIAEWVTELANDPDVDSYSSLAYDDAR